MGIQEQINQGCVQELLTQGQEENNSVELLLYGEQSWGYDGDRGQVLIPNADMGMDAQGAGWG